MSGSAVILNSSFNPHDNPMWELELFMLIFCRYRMNHFTYKEDDLTNTKELRYNHIHITKEIHFSLTKVPVICTRII